MVDAKSLINQRMDMFAVSLAVLYLCRKTYPNQIFILTLTCMLLYQGHVLIKMEDLVRSMRLVDLHSVTVSNMSFICLAI